MQDRFPDPGKKWEVLELTVGGPGCDVDPEVIEEMYHPSGVPWASFDCECRPKDAPDNDPFDFEFQVLNSSEPKACPRCGTLVRFTVTVTFERYRPLAMKYPGTDRPELGLRDKEEPQNANS